MIKPDYDIFISYRRGSGLYLAKNIATSLQSFGYKVFFYNRENEMCIFSKRNVHFLYFFRGFPARS